MEEQLRRHIARIGRHHRVAQSRPENGIQRHRNEQNAEVQAVEKVGTGLTAGECLCGKQLGVHADGIGRAHAEVQVHAGEGV